MVARINPVEDDSSMRGRMLELIKKQFLAGALALLLALALFVPGCSGSGTPVGSASASLEHLAKALDAQTARLKGYKIENGKMVFFSDEKIRGKLPPASPPQIVTHGNTDLKRVALTIDDGWNEDPRILDLLKRLKVGFTAFLIGGRGVAESNPDFIRRIVDAGGEVCSHTWSHYVMPGKDQAFVVEEIWKSQEVITNVTHEIVPYVRFSGGGYNQANLDWAAEQGFWVVNWSASSADASKGITADAQVAAIMRNVSPGAIIICHFGGYNTYDVLARVIPQIQKQGYEVTTLSRCLEGTPFYLKPQSSKKK